MFRSVGFLCERKSFQTMALKTFVKISNISNLSDARYCAGMMVDVLGFNIDPTSDSQVSEEDFKEITEWVAGVKFAGEFHGADLNQIKESVKKYPVDYVEIHSLDLVEQVHLLGKPIIFRLSIEDENELSKLKSNLSYLDELVKMVVVQSSNSTLTDQIDSQIGYYNGNLKLLKGYGIAEDKNMGNYPGLALEATEEDRPGYKDYGQIMDVLELIEED
ncbi:phosphoribosylanthranilate isomerase [Ekhidna lutea]|uniref:phosphoribosylanthranilate isomerase n=2 Tax=Ekhidna lutea TaxID=447679 RepID=A0A239GU81_EKHLU|nr:phosphoribosylanthranilate isomerase [Ekhidna lutea]